DAASTLFAAGGSKNPAAGGGSNPSCFDRHPSQDVFLGHPPACRLPVGAQRMRKLLVFVPFAQAGLKTAPIINPDARFSPVSGVSRHSSALSLVLRIYEYAAWRGRDRHPAASGPRTLSRRRHHQTDVHDLVAVVDLAAERAHGEVGLVEREG